MAGCHPAGIMLAFISKQKHFKADSQINSQNKKYREVKINYFFNAQRDNQNRRRAAALNRNRQ